MAAMHFRPLSPLLALEAVTHCLLHHRHLFFKLFQLHTLNLKSDFRSLQSVTPRSQLAPFLFSLHCGEFCPSDSSSGPSSALFPKSHVIWQPVTIFLWCCERSHHICKEYVCFLKARILSEALEDTLLLKGRGGQGRVTGMLPPEPALPFQALH